MFFDNLQSINTLTIEQKNMLKKNLDCFFSYEEQTWSWVQKGYNSAQWITCADAKNATGIAISFAEISSSEPVLLIRLNGLKTQKSLEFEYDKTHKTIYITKIVPKWLSHLQEGSELDSEASRSRGTSPVNLGNNPPATETSPTDRSPSPPNDYGVLTHF